MFKWYLVLFLILLLLYFVLLFVNFGGKKSYPVIAPIDVGELPDVSDTTRYELCGSPWKNITPGFWYDKVQGITVSIIPTQDPPIARFNTEPVFLYGEGRRACFPL